MNEEADLVEVIVATTRLDFRPFIRQDLDDLVRMFASGRAKRYPCLSGNREETRQYLQQQIRLYDRQGFGQLAAIEHETGRFAGTCGFAFEIIDDFREFILSCTLGSKFQKNKQDFETLRALCEFAFDQLDFLRIAMLIKPGSRREIKTAEKLGMEFEKEVVLGRFTLRLYAINDI